MDGTRRDKEAVGIGTKTNRRSGLMVQPRIPHNSSSIGNICDAHVPMSNSRRKEIFISSDISAAIKSGLVKESKEVLKL